MVAVSVEERFWSKVNKTESCWLWVAGHTNNGYGVFNAKEFSSRMAHRISYELSVGMIPEGLQIDHLCKVTLCVNPTHLEPVTPQENVNRSDMAQLNRERLTQTHCNRGHELSGNNVNPSAKGRRRRCRLCGRIRIWEYRIKRGLTKAPRPTPLSADEIKARWYSDRQKGEQK